MTCVDVTNKNDIWIKAAAIGSIWASFEIVVGGFLHALRMPFAGTFLTFFSVALLTAFARRYRRKGLFWRAALVAALLRSVMPTTVIFGPLIAIILEGLLFEAAVRLLGFRLAAYMLAGIAAMFSAILHKIVSLLILYGGDMIPLTKQLYYMFLHVTGWHLPLRQLIIWLSIVYVLAGVASALLGWYAAKGKSVAIHSFEFSQIKEDSPGWQIPPNFHFSQQLIFLHVVFLLIFLIALEWAPFWYVIGPLSLYEYWLLKRYGYGMRRLAKPVFWFQLAIILFLAIWIWPDKWQGFMIGFKMILRALLLVSIFTAIGLELRNPLVYQLLVRKGWTPLYHALQAAMRTLPAIVAYLGRSGGNWFRPVRMMRFILEASDSVIQQMAQHYETR